MPLGELVDLKYGKALKAEERPENGRFPVYGSNGIVGTSDRALVDHPTIVIGRKGAVGEAHLAEHGCWPIDTTFYTSPRPGTNFNLRYLLLCIRSIDLKQVAITSTIPGLNRATLASQTILVPPLPEQERIVRILDAAEELRRLRAEADRRTADLIPALFHEMFGDVGHSRRDSSLEDAVAQFIDYRGKTPTKSTVGVPLVTAKIVKGGRILPANEFIPEGSYATWMRRGLPHAGDVLFTTEAPLGEVAMVDDTHIALAQRILLMRPRPDVLDSRYFMTALTMPFVWKQIEGRATGSTVRGIRQAELRKVQIPIPPLDQQRDFAMRVAEVRSLEARQAASGRRLDDLFQSLLHRAFQGEL